MKRMIFLFLLLLPAPAMPAQENSFALSEPSSGAIYSVTTRYNNRNEYIHLAKIDPSGFLVWETNYDIGLNMKPVHMAVNASGPVVLAVQNLPTYRSYVLIKYGVNNYMAWARSFNDGSNNIPVAVAMEEDGDIYICTNTKFGPYYRAKLWKYDSSGNVRWTADYSASGNVYANQLQVLPNGNVLMAVSVFYGTTGSGQYEYLTVAYDGDGRRINR